MTDIEIAFACVAAIMFAVIIGLVFMVYDERRIARRYQPRVKPSGLRELLSNADRDRWDDR